MRLRTNSARAALRASPSRALPTEPLEVGGLGVKEEGVDGGEVEAGDALHDDAEAEVGEEEEGFFAGEEAGVFEGADGAADLVVEHQRAFVFQNLSRIFLGHDDAGNDDVVEFVEDFFFAAAEGGLVGYLVEVAGGFGAFAVETADGQAHVFGGAEDFFDLAGELEGGEVEHDADADARADVGRTGGEVAEEAERRRSRDVPGGRRRGGRLRTRRL